MQMTHISQSAWLNVYGTCKKCGDTVSHYCCIDALVAVRPLAEGFDWSVACDNDRCKTLEHGTPIELLRCELSAVGYREIATHQLAGDGGYLAVFSPPGHAGRKSPGDIVACGDRAGPR